VGEPDEKPELIMPMETSTQRDWNLLFACWLIATASALGSLFFSEVMGFAPCVLCWYQRIAVFPLVLILPIGLFPFDVKAAKFALPLTVAGLLVAVYHNLLYAGVIPKSIQPCTQGVPCTEKYIELFGFLSIPLLSLLALAAMTALLTIVKRRNHS
jgi:disulfide bond formation protein DsbB